MTKINQQEKTYQGTEVPNDILRSPHLMPVLSPLSTPQQSYLHRGRSVALCGNDRLTCLKSKGSLKNTLRQSANSPSPAWRNSKISYFMKEFSAAWVSYLKFADVYQGQGTEDPKSTQRGELRSQGSARTWPQCPETTSLQDVHDGLWVKQLLKLGHHRKGSLVDSKLAEVLLCLRGWSEDEICETEATHYTDWKTH